jgi:SAM-dependent methyltransferase
MGEIPDYSVLPLPRILCLLRERSLSLAPRQTLDFLILDPDRCEGKYAGERIRLGSAEYRCRSWRSWNALAELLGFRMLTPRPVDSHRLLLRFSKLDSDSFHREKGEKRYGPGSHFWRILKEEEPGFLYYYTRALNRLEIGKRKRVLSLGLNRGDELEPLGQLAGDLFGRMEIVGVDRDCDALAEARKRYPEGLLTLCHDLNDLDTLALGRFDLILSIGTLQSPGIEMKPLIMHLVREHLAPGGALLLGWPNARWIDGELLYGAKVPNYSFSELSLVIKDLHWIKKYLQQHRFRVVITGREYLFLEATPIRR